MPAKAVTVQLPAYQLTPVEALIPYAMNSRTHSPRQIDLLAGSIKEFGWTNPVLIDGERGIIAGHGRVMAAQKLGLKEVPTLELSHLTPGQARAYVIADNRLAEIGSGWDTDILAQELGSLNEDGFNLEAIGYDKAALDALLEGWTPDMDKIDKVEPDDAPLNATIKVKCPQEIAEAVEEAIKEAVAAAGFTDVEVG
jgi:ParB-like chromosome segregation protein Spo0J